MTVVDSGASVDARSAFEAWLGDLRDVFESGSVDAIDGILRPDGFWKDMLAFSWRYRTLSGIEAIRQALRESIDRVRPSDVRPAAGRTPPRLVRRSATDVIEGYFDFETSIGHGTGFARLTFDLDGNAKAWFLLTTLQEIRGFEERRGIRRPSGLDYSMNFAGPNWLDKRVEHQRYVDRDPEVLIVGGGQSGLTLAARLGQMGADALIVERNERIGDNWRHRYHSLTLHNEIWGNSLPYMPFPDTWPTFVPKDKLAGWLESYAEAMELNVWTSAELVHADYQEDDGLWHAQVRGRDGLRELRVPHLVLATGGASGVPHIPELAGLDGFKGEVVHSSQFRSGEEYRNKHAVVVGTGTSGHDVAQELHANGAAAVTIVQRSPTCVVSLVPSGTLVYGLYSEGPPPDDVDLITAAIPYPMLCETYQFLTRKTCELDRDLLDRLHEVGFETDFGEDETGFFMMYLRKGGGYYINVGCSELIADGDVGLAHARDVDRFDEAGLVLRDGRHIPADLVVLATGYMNLQEAVRSLLGDEIAERVGPVWGFDDGFQSMRNMWQRTPQPGLWMMGGSLIDCRLYSRFLALQIKAALEGLLPEGDIA